MFTFKLNFHLKICSHLEIEINVIITSLEFKYNVDFVFIVTGKFYFKTVHLIFFSFQDGMRGLEFQIQKHS